MDHEIEIMKNIAPEKLYRHREPKECFALDLLEKRFSNQSKYLYKHLFFCIINDYISEFE